jgi:hypothetical protein
MHHLSRTSDIGALQDDEISIIDAWNRRLRRYKVAERILVWTLLGGIASFTIFTFLLFRAGSFTLPVVVAMIFTMTLAFVLAYLLMTIQRLLKCPRCGANALENALTCDTCLAPLSLVSPFSKWSQRRLVEDNARKQ